MIVVCVVASGRVALPAPYGSLFALGVLSGMAVSLTTDVVRRRFLLPGSLLDAAQYLFDRATREDIEAMITDLGLDALEMRERRRLPRWWIAFVIKVREVHCLWALVMEKLKAGIFGRAK